MENDVKRKVSTIIELLDSLDSAENYSNVYLSSKCIKSFIDSLEQSIHLINLDEQK